MTFSNLPFYYESHKSPDNGGKPHILPFNLSYDKDLRMFRQRSTPELNKILQEVYKEGSLVEGSISSESGEHYIPKMLDYIAIHFPLNSDIKILEIGYGSGSFLKKLYNLGYKNLVGIEPGNHQLSDGLEGIKLIKDFYPSKIFKEQVDIIFHSLVLEHIENALDFLRNQSIQLNDRGKLIFFVPNEEPFLNSGDVSIFIHEHFNYFTRESILSLIKKAGLYVEDLSTIDGLFAITLTKQKSLNEHPLLNTFDVNVFFNKVRSNMKIITKFFKPYFENEVALYVPARALNSMYLLNIKNTRLVDDNTEIHNKYLPFFSNKVESFEMIIENPPKAILIFSRTFGNTIKNKCLSYKKLSNTKICTLVDIAC